ncbi:MAG: hypothetical protein GY952_12860 [Rhodobacteraceae bacterium]|nr:hypothetical protein [Paracoccaceae bacterium]
MEKVLNTWLNHQCRALPGSIHAVLLTGPPDEGSYNCTLHWPAERRDHSVLSRVAQAALRKQQAVLKTRNNADEKTGEPLDALACPLYLSGRLFGVVAIEMTNRSQPMQRA